MSTHVKPDVPSGFVELLPEEQMEFDRLKAIVAKHYELHGFLRLETPCVERLSILLAKANEEDQKLIYGVDTLIDGNPENRFAIRLDGPFGPLCRSALWRGN